MEDYMIKYEGYEGLNLENLSIANLKNFKSFVSRFANSIIMRDNEIILPKESTYTFEEVKEKAKEFLESHMNMHDIYKLSLEEAEALNKMLATYTSAEAFYGVVNSRIKSIDPFDLEFRNKDINVLNSSTVKPLLVSLAGPTHSDRKLYFSHVTTSTIYSDLAISTIVHEITHTQQESNFGYARDLIHREILPIFMELVYSYEMCPEDLTIYKKARFGDVLEKYLALQNGNVRKETLIYLKSTFLAFKLFDMYVSERKQKNRDKILYEVNDVFDGKMQVEDLLDKKGINLVKSTDLGFLQKTFL